MAVKVKVLGFESRFKPKLPRLQNFYPTTHWKGPHKTNWDFYIFPYLTFPGLVPMFVFWWLLVQRAVWWTCREFLHLWYHSSVLLSFLNDLPGGPEKKRITECSLSQIAKRRTTNNEREYPNTNYILQTCSPFISQFILTLRHLVAYWQKCWVTMINCTQ